MRSTRVRRRRSRTWWLRHAAHGVESRLRARVVDWRLRYVSRTTLYTRTLLWITGAICVALLVFTASEAWVGHRLQQQVLQAQAENARLRQDALATTQRATRAEAPGTIEDEARAMGYARPGEQPVAIATTAQPPAAPTPRSARAAGGSGAQPGSWLGWWQNLFGG
jgi:cell division protein FtsB